MERILKIASKSQADFRHSGQHAADVARGGLVRHWAVGNREMRFLREAMAIDLQQDILHPDGRAAAKRRLDERRLDVPKVNDFIPALQSFRTLAINDQSNRSALGTHRFQRAYPGLSRYK